MSPKSGRTKRGEKGLLTPDNCVAAIIDLQPRMLFSMNSWDDKNFVKTTQLSIFSEK